MFYLSPPQYALLRILNDQGPQVRPRSVAPNTVRSCLRRNWIKKAPDGASEITRPHRH